MRLRAPPTDLRKLAVYSAGTQVLSARGIRLPTKIKANCAVVSAPIIIRFCNAVVPKLGINYPQG